MSNRLESDNMRRLTLILTLFSLLMFSLPLAAQDDSVQDGDFIAVRVVCDSGNSQVVLVSPNGETVIPVEGDASRQPQWTQGGNRLHYIAREAGHWSIFSQGMDGGRFSAQRMGGDDAWLTQFRSPFTWSPDSRYYAYVITNQLVVNTSAGESIALYEGVGAITNRLVWSPDSARVAFTSYDDQISLLDVNTTNVSVVTDVTLAHAPAISPDGTKVAFIAEDVPGIDPSMNNALTLVDLATGTQTVLEDRLRLQGDIAWSPDGTQLAFTASVTYAEDAGSDIYLIGADGTNVHNITNFPGDERQPTWSADGQRLAFVYEARDFEDARLVIMDAEGLSAYVLVDGVQMIDSPAWRPVLVETAPALDTDSVPESLSVGVIAQIFVQDEGLRLREAPTVSSGAITSMPSGTFAEIISDSQDADGYTWWHLRLNDGRTGWAVESADGIQTLTPIAYADIARQPAQIPCE